MEDLLAIIGGVTVVAEAVYYLAKFGATYDMYRTEKQPEKKQFLRRLIYLPCPLDLIVARREIKRARLEESIQE